MSTIATTSVFDWKAYENGLLKQHNPSYFDNSTRMRSIAAGMVACAAALASYAIRAKITSTPIIIAGSALVTIVLLVSRRIFNKTYTDQKVHQYITLCKDYINKAAQEKKGLRDIQNEKFHLYSEMKSIIWVHIKHHELTLSYKDIIARNGDIDPLLTAKERNTLGLKYLEEITADGLSKEFQKAYEGAKSFNLEDEFRNNPKVQSYITAYVNGYDFKETSCEHYLFLLKNSFISDPRSSLILNTAKLLADTEKLVNKKISTRNEKLSSDLDEHNRNCSVRINALTQQTKAAQEILQKTEAKLKTLIDTVQSKSGDFSKSLPQLLDDAFKAVDEEQFDEARFSASIREYQAEVSKQNDEAQFHKDEKTKAANQIIRLNEEINKFRKDLENDRSKLVKESEKDIALYEAAYNKTTTEIIATYQSQVKQIS